MLSLEHIRSICSGEIHISDPLAPMTSFRLGGPVDIYIEPTDTAELAALVRYLRETETTYLVLGNGSNILISDEGFRGVALNIEKNFSRFFSARLNPFWRQKVMNRSTSLPGSPSTIAVRFF